MMNDCRKTIAEIWKCDSPSKYIKSFLMDSSSQMFVCQRTIKKILFRLHRSTPETSSIEFDTSDESAIALMPFNRERWGFCSLSQFEYLLQLNFNIFLVFAFYWSFIFFSLSLHGSFFLSVSVRKIRHRINSFFLAFHFSLLPPPRLPTVDVERNHRYIYLCINLMPEIWFLSFHKNIEIPKKL